VGYSFKGLHILIKSIALVKELYPNIKLKMASSEPRFGVLGSGYFNLINKLIRNLNLTENVVWTGRLSAKEIVTELQNAHVFVQPSFVESYSVAFAEAMAVGTPCVISFAGAMPELAKSGEEALFFQAGDFAICAEHIVGLIANQTEAKKISNNARLRSRNRVDNVDLKDIHRKLYTQLVGY
jgi:glycosyltransferase involved in cell wall biosynthesis